MQDEHSCCSAGDIAKAGESLRKFLRDLDGTSAASTALGGTDVFPIRRAVACSAPGLAETILCEYSLPPASTHGHATAPPEQNKGIAFAMPRILAPKSSTLPERGLEPPRP